MIEPNRLISNSLSILLLAISVLLSVTQAALSFLILSTSLFFVGPHYLPKYFTEFTHFTSLYGYGGFFIICAILLSFLFSRVNTFPQLINNLLDLVILPYSFIFVVYRMYVQMQFLYRQRRV